MRSIRAANSHDAVNFRKIEEKSKTLQVAGACVGFKRITSKASPHADTKTQLFLSRNLSFLLKGWACKCA